MDSAESLPQTVPSRPVGSVTPAPEEEEEEENLGDFVCLEGTLIQYKSDVGPTE